MTADVLYPIHGRLVRQSDFGIWRFEAHASDQAPAHLRVHHLHPFQVENVPAELLQPGVAVILEPKRLRDGGTRFWIASIETDPEARCADCGEAYRDHARPAGPADCAWNPGGEL